jgi:DNA helicase-2/ATP-dependent DNA helicase PcrA
MFKPSSYQQAIFDFIRTGNGHAVVEAVAGSGKSTTLEQALRYIPADKKVIVVAFNKAIATAMEARLKKAGLKNVAAKTLHSVGFGIVRKHRKVRMDGYTVYNAFEDLWPKPEGHTPQAKEARNAWFETKRIVKQLASLAKGELVDPTDRIQLEQLAYHHDILGNGTLDTALDMLPRVYERCEAGTSIDFDDMIYLPVANGWKPTYRYDFVFVDETQDLNRCQIELALSLVKSTGRIIAVGDRHQSIYGFRGADSDAIPNIIKRLDATTLPLSITYRCPNSVVSLAQQLVPHIEASPTAKDGEVRDMDTDQFVDQVQEDDMVLCRKNAPLISCAFRLIRQGRKAVVRGRDIGKNLIQVIDKCSKKNVPLDEVFGCIQDYRVREISKMEKKRNGEQLIDQFNDKMDCLELFFEGRDTVEEVKKAIEHLFSDDIRGIVLSSIHKAKGLEADNIFIIDPASLPMDWVAAKYGEESWQYQQELNCEYVAYTRAKSTLTFVHPAQTESQQ